MGKLSLREAVKRFDVSRPTLLKALKSGKVSAAKNEQGNWEIDPAELARVFQGRTSTEPLETAPSPQDFIGVSHPSSAQHEARLVALEAELEKERSRRVAAETIAEERGRHLEDLRRLLPAPERIKTRRGWWPW